MDDLLLPLSVTENIRAPEIPRKISFSDQDAIDIVNRLKSINRKMNTPMVDTSINTPAIVETSSSTAMVASDKHGVVNSSNYSRHGVHANRANSALLHYSKLGDYSRAKEVYDLMKLLKIDISPSVYPAYMKLGTKEGKYADMDSVFDGFVLANNASAVPNVFAWTAKIVNTARAGKPDEALKIVNQLQKAGAPLSVRMFNSILASYIKLGNFKEAYQIWERMHEEPGVELDTFSFSIMMKYCLYTQQPEKAFFYIDEMRSVGLKPDLMTFQNLFTACATAPFWVNGYQDIIFEAMCLMEGAELLPNTEIYNSIIFAFAKAGDAVSAEFYFWELIRKGLKPDVSTFEYLLSSYGESQSIGASRYGKKGRYVKPEPRPLSDDQQMYQELGAENVASASKKKMCTIKTVAFKFVLVLILSLLFLWAVSSGISDEVKIHKGKRTRAVLTDILDEDPSFSSSVLRDARQQIDTNTSDSNSHWSHSLVDETSDGFARTRGRRTRTSRKSETEIAYDNLIGDDDNVNLDELAKDDPELQAIISEIRRQDPKLLDSAIKEVNDMDYDEDTEYDDGSMFDNGNEEEIKTPKQMTTTSPRNVEYTALQQKLANSDTFYDVFNDLGTTKGHVVSALRTRAVVDTTKVSPSSTDTALAAVDAAAAVTDAALRTTAIASTLDMVDGVRSDYALHHHRRQRMDSSSAVVLDDSTSAVKTSEIFDMGGSVDAFWDLVEFGRSPEPDFSQHITHRRKQNQQRAALAFEYMSKAYPNLQPTTKLLSRYVAVHANAAHKEGAENVMSLFDKYGLQPDLVTFDTLIKMHVLVRDIDAAQAMKEDVVKNKKLVPFGRTYGILIESQTKRNMIVEALKNLEEATSLNVKVPERHVKWLRLRCASLGIVHPDMPADPIAWAKDVKHIRKNAKNSSQRKLEAVRSIF